MEGDLDDQRKRVASSADYLELFKSNREAALDRAHEIRKFEIDLLWKRATYFWAFNAAAFAGYVTLSDETPDRLNTFLICCLGFVFSTAWYIVNRGSSYWQRNWEKHVDLLEDAIEGPLHKLVIERKHFRLFDLTGPYRFSPARTNTLLSLLLVCLWVVLAAKTLLADQFKLTFWPQAAVLGLLTIIAAVLMVWKGRTGRIKSSRAVNLVMREYD